MTQSVASNIAPSQNVVNMRKVISQQLLSKHFLADLETHMQAIFDNYAGARTEDTKHRVIIRDADLMVSESAYPKETIELFAKALGISVTKYKTMVTESDNNQLYTVIPMGKALPLLMPIISAPEEKKPAKILALWHHLNLAQGPFTIAVLGQGTTEQSITQAAQS